MIDGSTSQCEVTGNRLLFATERAILAREQGADCSRFSLCDLTSFQLIQL